MRTTRRVQIRLPAQELHAYEAEHLTALPPQDRHYKPGCRLNDYMRMRWDLKNYASRGTSRPQDFRDSKRMTATQYPWTDAAWADIEYHVDSTGTKHWLRIKSFDPSRTAKLGSSQNVSQNVR